ncbi:MAG: transcription antitermination factor NusB [Thermomicrobiales bacterium]
MKDDEDNDAPPQGRRAAKSQGHATDIPARRHQGRMLALQVLYEVDLTAHDPEEAMTRAFAEHDPLTDDVIKQVHGLVRGVLQHRDDLDPIIAAVAPARTLAEQAVIERNVLRLAVYELLHVPRVPPKVAINEGVELAKRFGGENSGKFVNGVLRTIYERHPRPDGAPAAE